jgi:hypothetical protein
MGGEGLHRLREDGTKYCNGRSQTRTEKSFWSMSPASDEGGPDIYPPGYRPLADAGSDSPLRCADVVPDGAAGSVVLTCRVASKETGIKMTEPRVQNVETELEKLQNCRIRGLLCGLHCPAESKKPEPCSRAGASAVAEPVRRLHLRAAGPGRPRRPPIWCGPRGWTTPALPVFPALRFRA